MPKLIPIDSIQIAPNRQRREFKQDSLNELAEAIRKHGLLHAIGTRQEADKIILVHGERRLRAIKDIYDLGGRFRYDSLEVPEGQVPCSDLGELSPLDREEAELSENINRDDLTFLERAQVTLRLSNLRGEQAALVGSAPPTTASISTEVRGSSEGWHQDQTRKELIVARNASNPVIKGAKSLDEAVKILKREEAAKKSEELAVSVGRTFTVELHRAHQEDSREWLKACPSDRFDVILTDPPYGMGADEFGDSDGKAAGAHNYKDDETYFFELLELCQSEFLRITKPAAHLYWFCDIDKFYISRSAFEKAGWWVHRTPLIWHKPGASRVPWPEHGPQRKWEMILYAVKGKRPVTKIYADLVTFNPDENLGHHAQKPVDLFENLLLRSVRPGDSILDPFMGSGTIFPAAHRLKCQAVGVERDPSAYGLALKRLEKLKEQPELEGLV